MSANGDSLTKADLIVALTGMRDELRGDIRAEVHHLKDDLIEMVRDVETKLLSEFHRYAKGQQFRLHSLDRHTSV